MFKIIVHYYVLLVYPIFPFGNYYLIALKFDNLWRVSCIFMREKKHFGIEEHTSCIKRLHFIIFMYTGLLAYRGTSDSMSH